MVHVPSQTSDENMEDTISMRRQPAYIKPMGDPAGPICSYHTKPTLTMDITTPFVLDMFDTAPLLINLHYTIHWSSRSSKSTPNRRQIFSPMTFGTTLPTESTQHFLTILNDVCLNRVRSATRYTCYSFENPKNCQTELYVSITYRSAYKHLPAQQHESKDQIITRRLTPPPPPSIATSYSPTSSTPSCPFAV